jgi:anti-sigma B factor antagonist
MDYKVKEVANVALIEVLGRIDHTTAKALEDALAPHLANCAGEDKILLLDFSGVSFISSAGLRVLMLAAKQCRKQNGKIFLAALQPMIQEVFQISRFDTVLEVFPTVRAALQMISPVALSKYDGE